MHADAGRTLLPIARAAIASVLRQAHAPAVEDAAWLQKPGATFVTLTQRGQLRGCIGTLQAQRSVLLDVKANAVAASLRDPRFSPLAASELSVTEIEVSLLSAMQPIAFASESEALAQLRPQVDGVVLAFGHYRSTFLPQVWEQLPDARHFMAQLKQKAGLPATFWHPGLRLERYTVSKWRESDLASQADTSKVTP
jgi:AmmeMemoRadiSam system protein A